MLLKIPQHYVGLVNPKHYEKRSATLWWKICIIMIKNRHHCNGKSAPLWCEIRHTMMENTQHYDGIREGGELLALAKQAVSSSTTLPPPFRSTLRIHFFVIWIPSSIPKNRVVCHQFGILELRIKHSVGRQIIIFFFFCIMKSW